MVCVGGEGRVSNAKSGEGRREHRSGVRLLNENTQVGIPTQP